MSKIMTKDFREMFLDDFQGGWRYTWNIMDHAHFGKKNPRFRDIGFHKVFDRYCDYIKKYQSTEINLRLKSIIDDILGKGHIQKDDLTIVAIDS